MVHFQKHLKNNVTSYLFIAPAMLLLVVFVLIPIVMALGLSLTEYNGFTAPVWVGLQNFAEAFQSISVQAAVKNTIIAAIVSVPLQIVPAIILAALLAAKFQNAFGRFVRSALFVPVLCSATVVATIFSYIFAADQGAFINMLLGHVGLKPVNWLGSKETALWIVILVSSWKSVGYFLVIFYAGIMDIPQSYYEASAIDGATPVKQFFYITLPSLRSVLIMVITICTIWAFQIFALTYSMTRGGPGYATTTLAMEMYSEGFTSYRLGYAGAIAVILFVIILLVNFMQRLLLKERD